MADRLSILNPNPKRVPGPDLLHHLVANTSDQNGPNAIEYLSPSGLIERISYAQLHNRANNLARLLRSSRRGGNGSDPIPFVAPLLIPQCPDLYIAQTAALKAGAAFCPISLDAPEERLRFILKDVSATLLLTTSNLREKLPDLGEDVCVIAVDDLQQGINGVEEAELPLYIEASAPAYVMYTSGSTGQPKGVVISHSAATQALLAHDRHIPAFTRFLNFAHPVFDVSVFEIFFPLFRGRTLVCGDRRLLMNDLSGFINQMAVDAAELTPSVASSLLKGRKSVPSLKLLLTIGEMLRNDVIEDFGGSDEDEGILWGMYGPTEAAIHCTLQTRFRKDMPTGNIGIPLDTVSCFIVKPASHDKAGKEEIEILFIGEIGELAVGGHQLAHGYLNRTEQTDAAFIDHPRYGRLYRTGDRARLTSSGSLECLGRISNGQVKLRGQVR